MEIISRWCYSTVIGDYKNNIVRSNKPALADFLQKSEHLFCLLKLDSDLILSLPACRDLKSQDKARKRMDIERRRQDIDMADHGCSFTVHRGYYHISLDSLHSLRKDDYCSALSYALAPLPRL